MGNCQGCDNFMNNENRSEFDDSVNYFIANLKQKISSDKHLPIIKVSDAKTSGNKQDWSS